MPSERLTPEQLQEIEARYSRYSQMTETECADSAAKDIPALLAEIRALREERSIVWRLRSDDFHASVEGKPELWAAGSTIAEAVGDLVMSHRDHFGFVVKPQTGRISEEGE